MSTGRQAGNPASDAANSAESCYISVYQTGALVKHTRTLAHHAARAADPEDEAGFAVAAILTAVAAAEAILAEFLHHTNRSKATRGFFRDPIAEKHKIIKKLKLVASATASGKQHDLDNDHPHIAELIKHRNALTHHEPENHRSRISGSRITPAGAQWALDSVQDFARAIWQGVEMPDWVKSGLSHDETT